MTSRVELGRIKMQRPGAFGNCTFDHRTVLQVINRDMMAQILDVSWEGFERVHVSGRPDSIAREQGVETHVRADVIYHVTAFEMCSEAFLIGQLPITEPETMRTGIGYPAFSSSGAANDANYRTWRDEFKREANNFTEQRLVGNS